MKKFKYHISILAPDEGQADRIMESMLENSFKESSTIDTGGQTEERTIEDKQEKLASMMEQMGKMLDVMEQSAKREIERLNRKFNS